MLVGLCVFLFGEGSVGWAGSLAFLLGVLCENLNSLTKRRWCRRLVVLAKISFRPPLFSLNFCIFLEFFLGDLFQMYFWPSLDIKVEGANFATSDFCTLPLSYILCCLLSELSNRAQGLHIALAGFFFERLLSDIFFARFPCSDSSVQWMPRQSLSVFITRVSQSLLKLLPAGVHSRVKSH